MTFASYISTNLLLSLFWKNFFKSLNIWQSYGGKVDCLKLPVRRGTVLLKDEELAREMTYGGQELL